jgi:F-type H+-transporting ATPase subunit epsilon
MLLEILTPDKEIYLGEASAIIFPGLDGLFAVLDRHAPMIAGLKKGKIKAETPTGIQFFEINGGVVEVKFNKVLVLAE